MVRRNRAKSSSLFLMELILAILFFSIASAVCVQFFVKSHLLSQNAQELNYAVSECGSVAEIIDTSDSLDGALAAIQELYPENAETTALSGETASAAAAGESAVVYIYYDENFAACEESAAAYRLACELNVDDSSMLTGELSVTSLDADAIYSLTVKHFLGRI